MSLKSIARDSKCSSDGAHMYRQAVTVVLMSSAWLAGAHQHILGWILCYSGPAVGGVWLEADRRMPHMQWYAWQTTMHGYAEVFADIL